jgi:Na+/melibiose symporter-like transporter
MLVLMMGTYMPRFYAGKLGLSLIAVGATIAVARLLDLGVDLALGWLMDKTKTAMGRYRPWYALGLPVLLVGVYKLFNPPADLTVGYLFFWYIISYIAYSLLVLSHAAWGATLAGSYNDRSRIFGWMQGVAVVGSVGLLMTPILTHGAIKPGAAASMGQIGLVIMALAVIAVPISLFFAPENVSVETKKERASLKDYLAVITTPSMLRLVIADLLLVLGPGTTGPIYIFFFHDAKGFPIDHVSLLLIPYIGAGLVGAPFWAHVAQRLGKHRTVQVACIVYALTQTMLMAIPAGLFWPTFAGMFSVGFCASAFVSLIRAMVADVSDEIRLNTGKERSGVLYALVTMTQKFGSSIVVSVVFPILQAVGYNPKEGAINTPHAIWGLEMCYLFAPIALVMVGGAIFFGYKLDAVRHAEIRTALDEQEAALAASEESLVGPVTGPVAGEKFGSRPRVAG